MFHLSPPTTLKLQGSAPTRWSNAPPAGITRRSASVCIVHSSATSSAQTTYSILKPDMFVVRTYDDNQVIFVHVPICKCRQSSHTLQSSIPGFAAEPPPTPLPQLPHLGPQMRPLTSLSPSAAAKRDAKKNKDPCGKSVVAQRSKGCRHASKHSTTALQHQNVTHHLVPPPRHTLPSLASPSTLGDVHSPRAHALVVHLAIHCMQLRNSRSNQHAETIGALHSEKLHVKL